jgi:hypothetical protein
MTIKYYDIIIIGSGISGLYSALNIQKFHPNTSFLVLEKYKKQWIGGRTSNEKFHEVSIVTGAGVGRKNKDKLLIKFMNEIGIEYSEYKSVIHYSQFNHLDIIEIINKLKILYRKHPELHDKTFKQFFIQTLREQLYQKFIMSVGYTDYENADIYETLYKIICNIVNLYNCNTLPEESELKRRQSLGNISLEIDTQYDKNQEISIIINKLLKLYKQECECIINLAKPITIDIIKYMVSRFKKNTKCDRSRWSRFHR